MDLSNVMAEVLMKNDKIDVKCVVFEMCAINYKSEVSHSMGETPQRWLVTSAAIVVDKVAMLRLHPPWKSSDHWRQNLRKNEKKP